MTLEEGAHAIGLKDAFGLSAAQRLTAMELGDDEPTRTLLLKMAKAYRRSLLVFYLDEPPRKGDRGQDFRTVQGAGQFTPELDALIRDIRSRQNLIRSMLDDSEGDTLPFVGSAKMETPAKELAAIIAKQIGCSLPDFQARENVDQAFAYLREKIEAAGVFVLLLGNLGSHHTNIPAEVFRGFAVSDAIAPLVVINDQDARQAWSFTALHELAHLWLGATGVSGSDAESAVERYCNDVASQILLPASELAAFGRNLPVRPDDAFAQISTFAERFKISRAMVSYGLFRAGFISRELWTELTTRFREEWLSSKARQAEKQKTGGPSYYVVRRHHMGAALLDLVRRSLGEGSTTYTKAGQVLGVKPRNVGPLLFPDSTRGPSAVRGAR